MGDELPSQTLVFWHFYQIDYRSRTPRTFIIFKILQPNTCQNLFCCTLSCVQVFWSVFQCPDIFIHNILKLCRHFGTETYRTLLWQFCNFKGEVIERIHMASHFSREIWVAMLVYRIFENGGISSLRSCEHARSPREKTLLREDFLCWNRFCLDYTRQNIRSWVSVSCRMHGSALVFGAGHELLQNTPNSRWLRNSQIKKTFIYYTRKI